MKCGSTNRLVSASGPNRRWILVLGFFIFCASLGAQSGTGYDIRWMGQFPPVEADKKGSFGEFVSKLVFGKKPGEVIKPFGIVATHPGHFLILDQGAGAVFECFNGEAELLRAMKKSSREFPSLVAMCKIRGGDLLFTDSRMNLVFRISGDKLSLLSGSVAFDHPTGIAYCKEKDEIWVVETGAHRITILNRDGDLVRYIGERGSGPGAFNYPTFIWIDGDGKVYVVDSMNFRVQVFDQEGSILHSFGESGDATGYMARPKGVATDSRGNIYVADALFHVVQIFDREGNYLYNFGGQGQGTGKFWMPAGIYNDEHDYIYVADSYNSRIQVFQRVKN